MNRLMIECGDRITIDRKISVTIVDIHPQRVLVEFAGPDGKPVRHVEVERLELSKGNGQPVRHTDGHTRSPSEIGKRKSNGQRPKGRQPILNGRR